MLTGKAYDDFQEYCMKRFGVTSIWDIYTRIQHDFLSQYMDIEVQERSLAIGTLAENESRDTMIRQVRAMNKCYNDNYDECVSMREDSDGEII